MIYKRKFMLVVLGMFLLHTNLAIARVVAVGATPKMRILTQPDGVKFKVRYLEGGNYTLWFPSRLETIKKHIPIVKNSKGYYVLAILVPVPPDYSGLSVRPTEVRADSPLAYKKKINGKWRFFISGTNKEVSYNTKKAILPDWPYGSFAPPGGLPSPDIYFTGIFNSDGSAIYYSQRNKRQWPGWSAYRTPFAGSIDWWFFMIAFFWLWKRRCQ